MDDLARVTLFAALINLPSCDSGGCLDAANGCDFPDDAGRDSPPPVHGEVNGCRAYDLETVNQKGHASATVGLTASGFTPRCLLADTGTAVTFSWDFDACPAVGGGYTATGMITPDPRSPIRLISTGTTMDVVFSAEGDYGFYCQPRTSGPQLGAVFIDPVPP